MYMSKRICVFGASITFGFKDYEAGGWCDMLKRWLMPEDISVFNLGICGDDSFDLLKRFDTECESRKPDCIILSVTGNDTQFLINKNHCRVLVKDTQNNFIKLIEQSKKYTENIIIVGLTKVDEKEINSIFIPNKNKYYKNVYIEKYDKLIQEIAETYNVKFINNLKLLNDYDLEDGLHPNAQGHKKMFERIKDFLIENKIIV